MDTEQKREAPVVKTHEEILSLLKDLDTIEERVKNLRLSENAPYDTGTTGQEVEIPEPSVETTEEQTPKRLIDTLHRDDKKRIHHSSFFERYKKERIQKNSPKRRIFSHKTHGSSLALPPRRKTHQLLRIRKEIARTVQSTFNLYISEEGALAGLNIKKPKK